MICAAELGRGYVGLELASALNTSQYMIGYDKNTKRRDDLIKNYNKNIKLNFSKLAKSNLLYTHDPGNLMQITFRHKHHSNVTYCNL